MPIVVVTGSPFSGKGSYVRDEIARREADGELGLVSIDYTSIYSSLVPGEQSSFRDDAVADTGSPRFVGYLFAVAMTQVLDRELSCYIAVPSPRRALEISDKADAPIVDIAWASKTSQPGSRHICPFWCGRSHEHESDQPGGAGRPRRRTYEMNTFSWGGLAWRPNGAIGGR